MTKNLYIANLSRFTTTSELIRAFSNFGTVTGARIMTDTETGESCGAGFVEMSEGADQALVAMNGCQLRGRLITVHRVMSRENAPPSGSRNEHNR